MESTISLPDAQSPTNKERVYEGTHAPPRSKTPIEDGNRIRRSIIPALITLAMIAGAATGGTALVRDRLAARAKIDLGRVVLAAASVDVGATDAAAVIDVTVAPQTKVHAGQELGRMRLSGVPNVGRPSVEVLLAPSDATVVAVFGSAGTTLRAGDPLVRLYDPAKLTFQADVPVAKLRKIRLGMAVSVRGAGAAMPVATTVDSVVPRVGPDAPSAPDVLTVVLRPVNPAQVRSIVPGVAFDATVDTTTARQGAPALGSA